MDTAPNLVLVGPMGAGKSTVGRRLAARLGFPFSDLDEEIEAAGRSIEAIFAEDGEPAFRDLESRHLRERLEGGDRVLATGGGAVLAPANRLALSSRGLVVYLRATPADLWQRLRRDKHRPLLKADNPRQRILDLVQQRDPLYLETADLVVGTGRQPVDLAVESIIDWLSQPECAERARSKCHAAGDRRAG